MFDSESTRSGDGHSAHPQGEELSKRIVFGLIRGAVQVARMCRIPLSELTDLLEMAHFRDCRAQGMTLRQIAGVAGVSMRKASQLSNRMKSNFLDPASEVELSRRIEFLLWAESCSRARIHRALPSDDPAAIDEALDRLVRDERIRLHRHKRLEVYQRTQKNSRLVGADQESRLDGLNHAIGVLAAAVYGRFFRGEEKALYRTISFYVRAEDVGELGAFYRELWDRIQRLEERARRDPNALRMEISVAYAPQGYLSEETRDEENDSDQQ